MGRTNDLAKIIHDKLSEHCENVYRGNAPTNSMFPHIVFEVDNVNAQSAPLYLYYLDIDIWHKKNGLQSIKRVINDLADDIEDSFCNQNIPTDTILPTFFLVRRFQVDDDDTKIKHIIIRSFVNLYDSLVITLLLNNILVQAPLLLLFFKMLVGLAKQKAVKLSQSN